MNLLAKRLAEIYTGEGCVIWLLSPNRQLNGATPAAVWTAGDHVAVMAIVDQLTSGAFT